MLPGEVQPGFRGAGASACLPSEAVQKDFVAAYGELLTREQRKAVLTLVLQELDEGGRKGVVVETPGEVDIVLDRLQHPELLSHIYNIVRARVECLSRPAGSGDGDAQR